MSGIQKRYMKPAFNQFLSIIQNNKNYIQEKLLK